MTQSWQQQIADDMRAMFDIGEQAIEITRYPLGDQNAPETVLAIVYLEEEEGTNQASGDGAITSDEHGDRERRTGHLELPPDQEVDDRDTFLIYEQLWCVQRETGRDPGAKGIRITRTEGRFTRLPRLRGGGKGGRR